MDGLKFVQGLMAALFIIAFLAIAYRIATFSGPTWGTIIFILAVISSPFLAWKLWQLWGELLE